MGVSPDNVSAFISLELPWRNNNYVAFTYPDAAFHFSAYAAEPFCAVLAFNHYAVETEQFNDYAEDFALPWISHLAD